jgi:2,3-bisphosphoglycerate-dependent phosphoglycerate mutase
MHNLVLLRHGLSEWNIQNRFTGWHDVDLADAGIAESRKAGQALRDARRIPIRYRVYVAA